MSHRHRRQIRYSAGNLVRGGVPLTPGAEANLVIAASGILGESGACFVHLEARLVEDAKLERNGYRVDASSWSRNSVVSTMASRCPELVAESARVLVDDFVEHYRAMDPGQPAR